ncbi:peptidase YpeB-like protein [Rhodococcus sp. OK519]|uniref:PepSY domain-containing protein n=1 Tax=Rhodococcus sp. OK519 TaxID=2135729 RepID=UPI000D3C0D05|nr:peptidase YpeB-like protein [Rhodococcus sp. OK519]
MAIRNGSASRTRTTAFALAGAALVALAGCGNDDDSSHDTTTNTTTSVAGSSVPNSSVPNSSGSGSAAPSTQALERAGATAVAAVPGSVLISIESEHDQTWEAQVVTSDGVEHHVDVSADGATVIGAPRIDNEDESDRAKHRDRVQAATLDYTAAAAAVLTAVQGGSITELNLDNDNGTTVWEADVIDGAGTKHEVTIDAATGQVLANTSGR